MDGLTEHETIFANYLTLIDKYGLKHQKVKQYGNEHSVLLKYWVDIIDKLPTKRPTLLENIIFEISVFCMFIGFIVVLLSVCVCISNWIK